MKVVFQNLFQGISIVLAVVLGTFVFCGLYLVGFYQGYNIGKSEAEIGFIEYLNNKVVEIRGNKPGPTPTTLPTPTAIMAKKVNWGGPELWSDVNKRRVELGVNPLNQKDELCTIASIRLNELLKIGELDAHEGFGNLRERRPDLEWIFEDYATIA